MLAWTGACLFSLAGCSDTKIDEAVRTIFTPQRSAQQYMLAAVAESDPDLRREAVAKIADSKEAQREWAIKGYVAIALLESDAQARCVAIRALGETGDPRAVETCLKIVNFENHEPEDVRPPEAVTRWDAMLVLAQRAEAGGVPAESADALRATFIDHLAHDDDRDVRAAAARGLGACRHNESIEALIAGLRDRDFPVVAACENSLVRLTGETHQCNAREWEAWFRDNAPHAFAKAGQIPESRRKPQVGMLKKSWDGTLEFLRDMNPLQP